MRLGIRLVLLLPLLFLPACSAISTLSQASRPLEVYQLRIPRIAPDSGGTLDLDLVVEEPRTGGALATDRIMIRPDPLRAQYLPGARWADPAPAMLRTLLLRSLMATGAVRSVGRQPVGGTADYALLGELTDFQAEIGARPEEVAIRLGLIIRLVRESDGTVVATRAFGAVEPAASVETGPIVAAFDRAAGRLLAETASWTASAIRRSHDPGDT